MRQFSTRYKLPVAASLLGGVTMYPELRARLAAMTDAETAALLSPAAGRQPTTTKAADQEPRDGSIHILAVRNNMYMLVGDGDNIVVQTGDQGAFMVDTGAGRI